jgi:hypothetical protein
MPKSHLAGKIDMLRKGERPDPDLRHLFKCVLSLIDIAAHALIFAAPGGGLVLVFGPVGGGAVVAVGTVCGIVKHWGRNKCGSSDLEHALEGPPEVPTEVR